MKKKSYATEGIKVKQNSSVTFSLPTNNSHQRPGSGSGFVFLSLGDKTGISNAFINPHLYERSRVALTPVGQ